MRRLVVLLLLSGCRPEGKGTQVRGVDEEKQPVAVDAAPTSAGNAVPDARPVETSKIPDAVAAPMQAGIYRVLGSSYERRYRTREITEQKSSRFFVELEFADGGAFRACLASKYKSASSASKYAPNGPHEGSSEDDLDKGLVGTWRSDGDAFVVTVDETSDGCDAKPTPAKVAELRCTRAQGPRRGGPAPGELLRRGFVETVAGKVRDGSGGAPVGRGGSSPALATAWS